MFDTSVASCVNDDQGLWLNPPSSSSSLTFFTRGRPFFKKTKLVWVDRLIIGKEKQLIYDITCHKKITCNLLIWSYMEKVHFPIIFASAIFYASPCILLDKIQMFPISHRNNKCKGSGKHYLIKVILSKH